MAPRWHATIYYRTDDGFTDVEHDIEEIEELQDLVEHGPDWNCIDKIVVELARPSGDPGITVEQSLKE
jgi:hypothetical protein